MSDSRWSSPVLSKGSGCITCTRISVDVVTGAITADSPGQSLPSLGFPLRVAYTYDSQDSYTGLLGGGRGALGEPVQRVTDLSGGDAYGVVIVRTMDGESLAYG